MLLFASKITLVLKICDKQEILLCPNCLSLIAENCLIHNMLVVKGLNFVHGEEFLPIFQILIFLFLEYIYVNYIPSFLMLPVSALSICPKYIQLSRTKRSCREI